MKIRTEAEIQHALEQLEDAKPGVVAAGDAVSVIGLAAMVMTLHWIAGSDEPGGFSEMLAKLDQVDQAEKN